MFEMLYSKIHRATVNETEINYEGSISVSPELMKAANLREYQKVTVVNINNGARFTTYVISTCKENYICLNGAAARLASAGDLVIIMAYTYLEEEDILNHKPKVVKVNSENKIIS